MQHLVHLWNISRSACPPPRSEDGAHTDRQGAPVYGRNLQLFHGSCFMVHSLRLVKTKTIHLPAATSPQDNLLVLVLRKKGKKVHNCCFIRARAQRAENAMEFSYYLIHPPARSGKEANPLCLPSLMASGPTSTRDCEITLSRDSIMHAL